MNNFIQKKVKTLVLTTALLTFAHSNLVFSIVAESNLKSAKQYLSYYKSNGESSNLSKSVNFYNQSQKEVKGVFPFAQNLTQINFSDLSVKSPTERTAYVNGLISQLETLITTEENNINNIKAGLEIADSEMNIVKLLPTIETKLKAAVAGLDTDKTVSYFKKLLAAKTLVTMLTSNATFYAEQKAKFATLEATINAASAKVESEKVKLAANDRSGMLGKDSFLTQKIKAIGLSADLNIIAGTLKALGFDEDTIKSKLEVKVTAPTDTVAKKSLIRRLLSGLWNGITYLPRQYCVQFDKELKDCGFGPKDQAPKAPEAPKAPVVATPDFKAFCDLSGEVTSVFSRFIFQANRSLNVAKLNELKDKFNQNSANEDIKDAYADTLIMIYKAWNNDVALKLNAEQHKEVLGAFEAYLSVRKDDKDIQNRYNTIKTYFMKNLADVDYINAEIAKLKNALTIEVEYEKDIKDASPRHLKGMFADKDNTANDSLVYLPIMVKTNELLTGNLVDDSIVKKNLEARLAKLKAENGQVFSCELIKRLNALSKVIKKDDIQTKRTIKALVELEPGFAAKEHKLAIYYFLLKYIQICK